MAAAEHAFDLSTQREREADLCEFEVSMVYRARFQVSQGYSEKPCLEIEREKKATDKWNL